MRVSGSKYHVDYNDFILQVNVVGYRTMGESIVVLFKEGERTFYSIVIDSFCLGREPAVYNRTADILDANGVNDSKLSMLVMTHPHEDHILGMDYLIEGYMGDFSKFFYPVHSFDVENGDVVLKEEEKRILKIVREKNEKKKTFSNQVGVTAGKYMLLDRVNLFDNDDPGEEHPIPVDIVALTPITSINDAKRENIRLDPNDLSVSIIIDIQDYYLFFGADVTNTHISCLDKETMSAVKFVKIPHHASDTAVKLLDFFDKNQLDNACCTSFYMGNSNLPNEDIVKSYESVSQRLDIIGCSTDDARTGVCGDICYQFKPGSRNIQTLVKVEGITNRVK